MSYEVPKSRASLDQNRFLFHFEGAKTEYSVPLIKFLKPALALKMSEMSEAEFVNVLFEDIAPGKKLFERFADTEQLEAWVHAWQEASGITVGESEGSAES